MNFLKHVLLCLSLLISFQSLSQDKLVKVNFIGLKYQYQGVKYKEKMLPKIFKDNRKASNLYREYKENRMIAGTFGVLSLVSFMIGSRKTKFNGDSYDISPFVPLSLLPATLGLIFNPIAKSKRKKAIKAFNEDLKSPSDIGMLSIEMHFGLTTNGVGVSVVF